MSATSAATAATAATAKVTAGCAVAGALISLIAGLAGGNPLGVILLRLVLSAAACAGLGVAVQLLLRRFVPEVLGTRAASPAAGPATQPAVDIVIDGDLPPVTEPQAEGRAAPDAGAEQADLEALVDEPPGDEGPSAVERLEAGPGGAPGAGVPEPGSLEQAPWEARGQELDSLEALSELDQQSPSAGRPAPGPAPTGLREAARAQAERVVAGQDPADLAKAVRTFMRKDQEG
jgi:hypothetical protein